MMRYICIAVLTAISIMAYSRTKVVITVNGNSMTATLADNEAAQQLKELLNSGSITISMSDYGGFEKVGALPQPLPASNTQITTEPGDIMLYQGDNLVIFYGSNTWSYTRLGRIDGATANNLKEFLGTGTISLTLSLDPASGIDELSSQVKKAKIIYDLNGNIITTRPLAPGIYIINGIKTVIRD